ncbi:MAG TPA: hypothetical protein VI489_05835 [Candidatus Brocadiaceae bacterium]
MQKNRIKIKVQMQIQLIFTFFIIFLSCNSPDNKSEQFIRDQQKQDSTPLNTTTGKSSNDTLVQQETTALNEPNIKLLRATVQLHIAGSGVPSYDTVKIDYGPDITFYEFGFNVEKSIIGKVSIDTIWISDNSFYLEKQKELFRTIIWTVFSETQLIHTTKLRKYKGQALVSYRINNKQNFFIVKSIKRLLDAIPQ